MTKRILWHANTALAAYILMAGVLLSLTSERIFAGGGLGYDGCSYGAIITRYDDIRSGILQLNSALYFRMVPALAIRGVMLVLGVPLTIPNAIIAFEVFNIALLTLAAWLFGSCCDRVGVSKEAKILGFIGVFINYFVLKYTFYYPVLLDTAAMSLSVLLAWLYLSRHSWWLLPAGIGAFFVGPNIGLEAFLLFLLPAGKTVGKSPFVPRFVAAALALLATGGCWWLLKVSEPHDPMAVLMTLGTVAGTVYCLTRAAGFIPATLLRRDMLMRLGFVVGMILFMSILPRLVPGLASFDWVALFFRYARLVLINNVHRTGEFLVAHTLYFGPIILLAVCLFAPVCRAARKFGGGWLLVLAFGTLQAFNPLSRQMVGILPFVVLPLCVVLCDRPLSPLFVLGMGITSLGCSKVWQHINTGADFSLPMDKQTDVWGRYLESTGYWMYEMDYRRQGIIVLCLFVVIAASVWRMRRIRL